MEKLLGTLAFSKVPKVERSRKREQKEGKEQDHEKRPKLLEDVLNGENPSSLVPSYTSDGINSINSLPVGIEITKEKAKKWMKVVLPLGQGNAIKAIKHWVREDAKPYQPPTDIPLHPTSVMNITSIFCYFGHFGHFDTLVVFVTTR